MNNPVFSEDGLVLEDSYARSMDGVVLPWLDGRRTDVTAAAADGKPLAVSRFDAERPRGTIMIVHGFTENAFKFSELTCSLLRSGWSVLAFDQRGHGRSWRDERIADISLTHVDRFDDYVSDMETVCSQTLRDMPKPWCVLSHSMGGAVTALYLEQHPEEFSKAVFCAPMIACSTGLPSFVTAAVCRGARLMGKGRKRVFVSRPYTGPEDFNTSCAKSRPRFDWYEACRVRTPALKNNGPTYEWTLQALGVTKRILRPGAVERIRIPVKVFGAEVDNQVLPGPMRAFTDRLPGGTLSVVPGSKHEIYRSPDAVLFPWWHEVLAFLGN